MSRPQRAYYSNDLGQFMDDDPAYILRKLKDSHPFDLRNEQWDAWETEIRILKQELHGLDSFRILIEYTIPRMGKRADVVLLGAGIVFVLEFKMGAESYNRSDIEQCEGYALDLSNFHATSHSIPIAPILIATNAPIKDNPLVLPKDGVLEPMCTNTHTLRSTIDNIIKKYGTKPFDHVEWENSPYAPTPTIIEAAQALYANHNVKDITRHGAGVSNLEKTAKAVSDIIDKSKHNNEKAICFITGVPGAGKTLAGLNIASERQNFKEGEHAVFLSGNGPLVQVLREALARDRKNNPNLPKIKIGKARQKTKSFIQNIHHFRDEYIVNKKPPHEHIVIFDEAQRAWDCNKTSLFMKQKKGIPNFNMSEPEFLVGVMDRYSDWSVIVCLVGGGQEINSGEAGISEWFNAIKQRYPHWRVYVSDKMTDSEYVGNGDINTMLTGIKHMTIDELHLGTSIRTFKASNMSSFVKALLDHDIDRAKGLLEHLDEYPIYLTRNFDRAKQWLRKTARAKERFGIIASAKSYRLRPDGIYVELTVNPIKWFLHDKDDVNSSYSLEYVATEFDIQGLELDWACVAWDANLRHDANKWKYHLFRSNRWMNINSKDNRKYLKNAYRVLLTRARQGIVIYVPEGTTDDCTRCPELYDSTYKYLKQIGLPDLKI